MAETATTKKDNEYRHIGPYNTPPEHTHGCMDMARAGKAPPGLHTAASRTEDYGAQPRPAVSEENMLVEGDLGGVGGGGVGWGGGVGRGRA